MSGFLVYVRGMRGPEPQKWPTLIVASSTGKTAEYVGRPVRLSEIEYALPLEVLRRKYPPREVTE